MVIRSNTVYFLMFRYVTCCAFSSNNQYLASGSNDKTVMIWKLSTEEELISMYHKHLCHCWDAVSFTQFAEYYTVDSRYLELAYLE